MRKKVVAKARAKVPTPQQVEIEERIAASARGENSHIIYLGGVVENALRGEFGAILKALTAGRTAMELSNNKDGKLSTDRIMGRLEMATQLWDDLETYVLDKDKLLAEQRENTQDEQLVSAPQ